LIETDVINQVAGYFGGSRLAIEVFIVVFLTLLANYVAKMVLARLHLRLTQTSNPWDDALLDAARKPLAVLIWILGIAIAAEIVHRSTDAVIFDMVPVAREVGVIACIAWFLLRFITRAEENILRRRADNNVEVDQTTVNAISKLLRLSVVITTVLIVLQTLGFSVSGVLAFGGIGGIVIGLAAKDLLANFFGGLMIYLDRPFKVGDWVRSPDRDIEGTVEHIGWRLTRIRTFDSRPLYVPNSTFTSIAVENPSRMHNRRIHETIGIRYDDAGQMESIVASVKQMLREHPEIDQDQTLIVAFNQFAPSSLDFFIYTFTRTTAWVKYHEVKQDVLIKVVGIIESYGAEIAFPTSTIHVPQTVKLLSENDFESRQPAYSR
jgi:MscS family membrane protein